MRQSLFSVALVLLAAACLWLYRGTLLMGDPLSASRIPLLDPSGMPPKDRYHSTIDASMRKAAVAAYDPASLQHSLETIGQWHREHGTAVASLLNPGLSDADIDARFAEIDCKPPAELRQLWKWRNGHADTPDASWFAWYHQFMPIDEAFHAYRELRSEPILGWDPSWFPVFRFDGEWYFVECGASEAVASPVVHYFAQTGPLHTYLNLTTYLATTAEAMRQGAIFMDGQPPVMKQHIKALARIHDRLNPGLPFGYNTAE